MCGGYYVAFSEARRRGFFFPSAYIDRLPPLLQRLMVSADEIKLKWTRCQLSNFTAQLSLHATSWTWSAPDVLHVICTRLHGCTLATRSSERVGDTLVYDRMHVCTLFPNNKMGTRSGIMSSLPAFYFFTLSLWVSRGKYANDSNDTVTVDSTIGPSSFVFVLFVLCFVLFCLYFALLRFELI